MAIVRTGESEYDKELAKWNRPYRFVPYPQMLYKAVKKPNGQVVCMEPPPSRLAFATDTAYLMALAEAEARLASNWIVAGDEREARMLKGQGWAETSTDALAQFERTAQAVGDAAAEVAYAVRRMSPQAQAELSAADAATHEHVTDVRPAPPKRSHTRKPALAATE